MAFDWLRFFDAHRIEYATSGPNVSAGNVAIHCPWCGPADSSQHLSVSTSGKGYRCFRQQDHRGRSPGRLVMALLTCSAEQAAAIVGTDVHVPEDFHSRVNALLRPSETASSGSIELVPEFRSLKETSPLIAPYGRYLERRGLEHWRRFTARYRMYWCMRGPFSGRIIFTVWHDGELKSWTGRAVSPIMDLRYKALSPELEKAKKEGLPCAVAPINHFLLWYDKLLRSDADTIMLCEGPFDALKVNELGRGHGIVATCFFTAFPTPQQIGLLHELLPRFKRKLSLLDAGTLATSLRMTKELRALGVEHGQLPSGCKDPGELRQIQLLNLVA